MSSHGLCPPDHGPGGPPLAAVPHLPSDQRTPLLRQLHAAYPTSGNRIRWGQLIAVATLTAIEHPIERSQALDAARRHLPPDSACHSQPER